MSLTEQEIHRYSRHIILQEVGGRGQLKLKKAAILIAGAGAVGSAAALYLAAAGVGRLTLWDPGVVGPGDLEGAIAHTAGAVGEPRSRSAVQPLRAINPDARVEALDRESDVVGTVPDHQVVLASAGRWDELATAAYAARVHLVLAGLRGARGAVAAFRPQPPCLRCLGPSQSGALGLLPETGVPAVAAAAGVVGVVAATEAIKLLLGIGEPLVGRVLTYDGWGAHFGEHGFSARDGCEVCGRSG